MNDFARIQFESLRAEILGIKERVIRLQIIGVTGIPVVIGAGQKLDLVAILMGAPLITLIFAFILVFEQNSLMRAGEYIRTQIEPRLCSDDLMGWEEWLEDRSERRQAETFFAWSAFIAFAMYFALGTYLAVQSIFLQFGTIVGFSSLGVYSGGFILALYLVVTNLRTHHK
jgi:hypothetical protein